MANDPKTLSDDSGLMSRLGGKAAAPAEPKKDAAPAAKPPADKGRPPPGGVVPASLRQQWEDLKEELHGELLDFLEACLRPLDVPDSREAIYSTYRRAVGALRCTRDNKRRRLWEMASRKRRRLWKIFPPH